MGRRHGGSEARRWCLRPPAPRHSISTVSHGTATTCSPTACSRSTRARANASGTSRASSTTCGTGTFPPPPSLVTVRRNGTPVEAVAQTTKFGDVFVLDRRPARRSSRSNTAKRRDRTVDGERTAPHAAAADQAAAVCAAGSHRGDVDDAHARGARGRARAVPQAQVRLSHAALVRGHDRVSRRSTAARNGVARRSIRRPALLYVNSNEMAWIVKIIPNNDTSLYNANCATCHREDRKGSPMAPSLVDIGKRMSRDEIATIVRQGTGRMPAFPDMGARNINDVAEFLVTGIDKGADPKLKSDPNWLKYRNDGYTIFPRPRRLPGDHAAVGHAQRDRPQRGHDPLEDPVRRVSGAGGEGPDQHRQRQLRRSGGDRQRVAVHRRHQLRQEVPRLRQADRRAAVGDDRCRRPATRRRRSTSSTAGNTW